MLNSPIEVSQMVNFPFQKHHFQWVMNYFYDQILSHYFQQMTTHENYNVKYIVQNFIENFNVLKEKTNIAMNKSLKLFLAVIQIIPQGAQWLSGRVFDLRPRDPGFKSHRRHCVVSLSKTHLSLLSTGSTQEDPSQHN